ncbi:MAG: GldG family protein [Clostridia bacterium]|nr:GldG family protein [Clostridia bacterium]
MKRNIKRIIRLIKEKWLRQTSLTILLVAIILIVFILINTIVNNLSLKPIDFTKEKIYSLSDESKNEVKKVEQNVTIYFFGYEEDETPVVLGKQYHDVNDKITVMIVKPEERPDLATEYGISSGDKLVAVQSSQRNKAISENDMYTYDTTTYKTIDVTEQKITNAILDVTIVSKPKVYFLAGHGEYGISESEPLYLLSQYVVNDVNDVSSLDLLSSDMPETCDVLVIANPTKDFTDIETEKIQTYINNGGKIIWLQDPYMNIKNYNADNFKNTNSILSQFGISFSRGYVLEESTDNMIAGLRDFIIPELTYNEIVKDIYTDGNIIMTDAGKITTASSDKLEELGVTVDTFIKSSENSYYKDFVNQNTTLDKAEGDEEGPFVLGETLTKKVSEDKNATLIAYSNALFSTNITIPLANTAIIPLGLRNNKDILLNTVAYLTNREDSIRIRKDTGAVNFETATESQDRIVKAVIFAVPVCIIIVGVIIAIIRKRKK